MSVTDAHREEPCTRGRKHTVAAAEVLDVRPRGAVQRVILLEQDVGLEPAPAALLMPEQRDRPAHLQQYRHTLRINIAHHRTGGCSTRRNSIAAVVHNPADVKWPPTCTTDDSNQAPVLRSTPAASICSVSTSFAT